jgi:prepilin-type processing-associated H-X9-DG protein
VGFGPTPSGQFTRPRRNIDFRRQSSLIAVADGVYAGRQEDGRLNGVDGTQNSRIGYRHKNGKFANAAFADGHAEPVYYKDFPRASGNGLTPADVRGENSGSYTIYADPAAN